MSAPLFEQGRCEAHQLLDVEILSASFPLAQLGAALSPSPAFLCVSRLGFFTGRFPELESHRMVLVMPSPFSVHKGSGEQNSVPTGCQGR